MIESMNKLHSNQVRRKYDGNMERRFTRRSSEKAQKISFGTDSTTTQVFLFVNLSMSS